jgi:deoxyribonuclease V
MRWPGDIAQARKVQERQAARVRLSPLEKPPASVAGVDAAFSAGEVFAAACLFAFPSLEPMEDSVAVVELRFPYVTGFLSFREGEAIMAAVRGLSRKPGLLLVDGQGIAHPRRIGIASHVGVLLDIPSVGCAKSRLIGEYAGLGCRKGAAVPLCDRGEMIGAVVRTRSDVRPLFVSPGHRVDLVQAVAFTLACTGTTRIPEPLRRADRLAGKAKRERPA